MKRLILFMLFPLSMAAQTTLITPTNTVQQANVGGGSIDLSQLTDYGTGGMYKDPFYADGTTFAYYGNQTTWKCQGTGTTTMWPTSYPESSGGYAANQFTVVTSTYTAYNGTTGAVLGSGTITANTASTGSAGPTFTLSNALASACTSGTDVMIVRQTALNSILTPLELFSRTGVIMSGTCSGGAGLTFNQADLDPNSYGLQSLVMPSGCTLQFAADQTMGNNTNPNSTIAATQMNNLQINGTYKVYMGYKCAASSGSGSLAAIVYRVSGNTFASSGALTPACTAADGSGWTEWSTTANNTNETVPPLGNLIFEITSNTGPIEISYAQFPESTSIGNNTVFKDKTFKELLAYKPSVIRNMDSSDWPASLQAQMTEGGSHSFPEGVQQWSNVSNYLAFNLYSPMSFPDVMELGAEIGADVSLSASYMNPASQYSSWTTTSTSWSLPANSHYVNLKNAGHKVIVEFGNEAFNSAAGGALYEGDGTVYGMVAAPLLQAFKGGSGYDSAHMKTILNGWYASGQLQNFGWGNNVCAAIAATTSVYPEWLDYAPYIFNNLATFTTSGANLGSSGEPWAGLNAEVPNYDSVASPPSGTPSMLQATQWINGHCGPANSVGSAVYEHGAGTIQGTATTQLQVDQMAAGVGMAIAQFEHDILMQRDADVTGYLGLFALSEVFNGFTCNGSPCPSQVSPVWGVEGPGGMACGSGDLSCANGVERPSFIVMAMHNAALSTLSSVNLMQSTQSGTPTYNYPGGQGGTIGANAATPYVACTPYSDTVGNWVMSCANADPTNSHQIQIAAIPPSGSITQLQFGASNNITDQNEGTYQGPSSLAPLVTGWTTTTGLTGTTQTLQPHTATEFIYASSGTPTPATPVFSPATGSYTGAQSVTISNVSGAPLVCYGTSSSITIGGASSCPGGTTHYTGAFSVSSSGSYYAKAGGTGWLDSPLGTVTYTITLPTAGTPTFTPAAGTYTSSQSVAISNPSGAPLLCWNTTGAAIAINGAGSCPSGSTLYTGSISVSSTETLYARAGGVGYVDSTTASALYTISTTLATPIISPAAGVYSTAQSVTFTNVPGGATACYAINAAPTAPTPGTCGGGSTTYTGAFTVSSSSTVEVLYTQAARTNSAVATAAYVIGPVLNFNGNLTITGAAKAQ